MQKYFLNFDINKPINTFVILIKVTKKQSTTLKLLTMNILHSILQITHVATTNTSGFQENINSTPLFNGSCNSYDEKAYKNLVFTYKATLDFTEHFNDWKNKAIESWKTHFIKYHSPLKERRKEQKYFVQTLEIMLNGFSREFVLFTTDICSKYQKICRDIVEHKIDSEEIKKRLKVIDKNELSSFMEKYQNGQITYDTFIYLIVKPYLALIVVPHKKDAFFEFLNHRCVGPDLELLYLEFFEANKHFYKFVKQAKSIINKFRWKDAAFNIKNVE